MIPRNRLRVVGIVLAAWAAVVWGRLAEVQVLEHDRWAELAARQRETKVSIDEPRGDIITRDGRILAGSVDRVDVYANPSRLKPAEIAELAGRLAPLLALPSKEIIHRLSSHEGFFYLARELDPAVEKEIAKLRQRGVGVLHVERRVYPNGRLAAAAVGFVNSDGKGQAGLEGFYDRTLAGTSSVYRLSRDGKSLPTRLDLQLEEPGRAGMSLHLSLDSRVQEIAEEELARALDEIGGVGASAVVLDPASGDILAMASLPTFDPTSPGASPPSSWRNRTVQDALEPGSTFKPIVVAGALEAGAIRPTQLVDCSGGGIQVATAFIRDHATYGLLPVRQVIAKSSNVGAIRIAQMLDPEALDATIRAFGFASPTGVELPAETAGLYRPPSEWSALSRAGLAIGQEIAVSPLQLARAFSVFATGGILCRPRLVLDTRDPDGNIVAPTRGATPHRILQPQIAGQVADMLEAVVVEGTGKRAAVPGFRVAGKTGTAQKAAGGGYKAGKHSAWFAGFLPLPEPRLVIVVCVDEPHTNYWASDVAAPIFSRIASRAVRVLRIPPRGTRL